MSKWDTLEITAAGMDYPTLVKGAISVLGVKIDQTDNKGWTALICAVDQGGRIGLVKALIQVLYLLLYIYISTFLSRIEDTEIKLYFKNQLTSIELVRSTIAKLSYLYIYNDLSLVYCLLQRLVRISFGNRILVYRACWRML